MTGIDRKALEEAIRGWFFFHPILGTREDEPARKIFAVLGKTAQFPSLDDLVDFLETELSEHLGPMPTDPLTYEQGQDWIRRATDFVLRPRGPRDFDISVPVCSGTKGYPEEIRLDGPLQVEDDLPSRLSLEFGAYEYGEDENLEPRQLEALLLSGTVSAFSVGGARAKMEALVETLVGFLLSSGVAAHSPVAGTESIRVSIGQEAAGRFLRPEVSHLVWSTSIREWPEEGWRITVPLKKDEPAHKSVLTWKGSPRLKLLLDGIRWTVVATNAPENWDELMRERAPMFGERARVLQTAARFFARSARAAEIGEAAMLLGLCLECLLIDDETRSGKGKGTAKSRDSLSRRIQEAVGHTLGRTPEAKQRYRLAVNRLYDARSNFVHEGRTTASPADFEEWRSVVAEVFRKALLDFGIACLDWMKYELEPDPVFP